jgi:hypothetical protein
MIKKDTALTLAFQTNADGTNSECVAVASYGAAHKVRDGVQVDYEQAFDDEEVNALLATGRVFELDLICSKGGSRSTGTLMMLYVLAKEFARKYKGGQKYLAAIISLAKKNGENPPLINISKRMGFKYIENSEDKDDPASLTYYILEGDNKEEKLKNALPKLKEVLKFCPTQKGTGIQYCV